MEVPLSSPFDITHRNSTDFLYKFFKLASRKLHRKVPELNQLDNGKRSHIGKNSRPAVLQEQRTPAKRNAEIVNSLNQVNKFVSETLR